ncbi:MAG: hypothetical protein HYS12_24000 [Planctomycetes bacterium]|nr:hypothetical protein [Planctomycetota bacterium]
MGETTVDLSPLYPPSEEPYSRLRRAVLDSTGFDCGHASPYFVRRCGQQVAHHRFGKLESVVDCGSHLYLAARGGGVTSGVHSTS